jgi:hypothetical protein
MRVVSTCHKAGWEQYGKRWLEGLKHWPEGTEFLLYTEGFDLDHPLVKTKRVETLERAETGFWLMDCSHPERRRFLDTWVQWLESGSFKNLEQWCDASTLDATVRTFTREKLIEVASLSGKFEKDEHPMSKVELSKYINHLKGALKNMEEP